MWIDTILFDFTLTYESFKAVHDTEIVLKLNLNDTLDR